MKCYEDGLWNFETVKLQHVLTKDGDDDDKDADDEEDADEEDEEDDDDAIADGLMKCLIQNKHHPAMDEKCRSGVEHHQLVSKELISYRY